MSSLPTVLRRLILGVCIGATQLSGTSSAEKPLGAPRVGGLSFELVDNPAGEGLRDGLRDLGYIEGKNIVLDWRATEEADDALRAAALDLSRAKADLIVAGSTPAVRAALTANPE